MMGNGRHFLWNFENTKNGRRTTNKPIKIKFIGGSSNTDFPKFYILILLAFPLQKEAKYSSIDRCLILLHSVFLFNHICLTYLVITFLATANFSSPHLFVNFLCYFGLLSEKNPSKVNFKYFLPFFF
jgi:hypothetical protein